MVLKVTCGCEATRVTAGERSDTETVTLREARGDGKRAISTSPVAYSTWYSCSRMMREKYELKAHYYRVSRQRRNQQCITEENV